MCLVCNKMVCVQYETKWFVFWISGSQMRRRWVSSTNCQHCSQQTLFSYYPNEGVTNGEFEYLHLKWIFFWRNCLDASVRTTDIRSRGGLIVLWRRLLLNRVTTAQNLCIHYTGGVLSVVIPSWRQSNFDPQMVCDILLTFT